MKVYVLIHQPAYEDGNIIDVYSSEGKAYEELFKARQEHPTDDVTDWRVDECEVNEGEPEKRPHQAVLMESTEGILFQFHRDAEVDVFVSSDFARPMRAFWLEDCDGFAISCPEQAEGDRFRIKRCWTEQELRSAPLQ